MKLCSLAKGCHINPAGEPSVSKDFSEADGSTKSATIWAGHNGLPYILYGELLARANTLELGKCCTHLGHFANEQYIFSANERLGRVLFLNQRCFQKRPHIRCFILILNSLKSNIGGQ